MEKIMVPTVITVKEEVTSLAAPKNMLVIT